MCARKLVVRNATMNETQTHSTSSSILSESQSSWRCFFSSKLNECALIHHCWLCHHSEVWRRRRRRRRGTLRELNHYHLPLSAPPKGCRPVDFRQTCCRHNHSREPCSSGTVCVVSHSVCCVTDKRATCLENRRLMWTRVQSRQRRAAALAALRGKNVDWLAAPPAEAAAAAAAVLLDCDLNR